MWYIGIDPGIYGAIALMQSNTPTNILIMPKNYEQLSMILENIMYSIPKGDITNGNVMALIEVPLAMPNRDCIAESDKFFNYGMICAMLLDRGIVLYKTYPSHWKSIMKLSSDKSDSINAVSLLFPNNSLVQSIKKYPDKFNDGAAEAVLLAWFLAKKLKYYPNPEPKPRLFKSGKNKGKPRPYKSTRFF